MQMTVFAGCAPSWIRPSTHIHTHTHTHNGVCVLPRLSIHVLSFQPRQMVSVQLVRALQMIRVVQFVWAMEVIRAVQMIRAVQVVWVMQIIRAVQDIWTM
jgi:hypothetical protein